MRIALSAYSVYLSVLLLSQDPNRWINTSTGVLSLLKTLSPVAHLISFIILSLLTFAACLPLPRWGILILLACYGAATEFIQAAVPHRTSEWGDWIQDLAGIAIGFACFLFILFLVRLLRKPGRLRVSTSS
jgi:VanZ family protein